MHPVPLFSSYFADPCFCRFFCRFYCSGLLRVSRRNCGHPHPFVCSGVLVPACRRRVTTTREVAVAAAAGVGRPVFGVVLLAPEVNVQGWAGQTGPASSGTETTRNLHPVFSCCLLYCAAARRHYMWGRCHRRCCSRHRRPRRGRAQSFFSTGTHRARFLRHANRHLRKKEQADARSSECCGGDMRIVNFLAASRPPRRSTHARSTGHPK